MNLVNDAIVALQAYPEIERKIFSVLRAVAPITWRLPVWVKAYENNGTILVTKYADVIEVLNRNKDFETVFAPRMTALTNGQNFFLGMPYGNEFTQDIENMRECVNFLDVQILGQRALKMARIRAMQPISDIENFAGLIVAEIMLDYFGLTRIAPADLLLTTTLMFAYLFTDTQADPYLDKQALAASARMNAAVDAAIATRKTSGLKYDDVLGRALIIQAAGRPRMDDVSIRNNFMGTIAGAVPSIAQAAANIVKQLQMPGIKDAAADAARAGTDETWLGYVMEGWRFNPIDIIMYRRAVRDTKLRYRNIPNDTMVILGTFSAMFDPDKIDNPDSFVPGRPDDNYLFFGHGMHECFGKYITRAVLPAILKPIMAKGVQ